jgi:hypothetical protein
MERRSMALPMGISAEEANIYRNLAASNRALELLGRHLGLWKEQPKTDESIATLFAWLSESSECDSIVE